MAVSTLGLVQYYVLMPLALLGAILLWRRRGPLLAVTAWIPIVTLTAAAAFGNTRYRTAAEMSVVILAAVAIDALVGHRTAQPDLEQVG
jgi:MYXO-CTERM domain-containing protein